MRFSIFDPINSTATPQQILQKFYGIVALEPTEADDDLDDLNRTITQDLDDEEDDDDDQDPSDESERRPEQIAKRKKRHRLARLKRKTKLKAYEFNGLSDIAGVLFLEIQRITDLPPERNGKSVLVLLCKQLLTSPQ